MVAHNELTNKFAIASEYCYSALEINSAPDNAAF
jgi:hypothetical protein